MVGGKPTTMVSGASVGGGCRYILRVTSGPSGAALPCAITTDFALVQP
jgi:hypothetical protein